MDDGNSIHFNWAIKNGQKKIYIMIINLAALRQLGQRKAYECYLTTVSDALAFVPILVNVYGCNSFVVIRHWSSSTQVFTVLQASQPHRGGKKGRRKNSMKIINFGVL